MQNIGPILWFIIIGALFYFMMRMGGCGGGGHSHGRGPGRGGGSEQRPGEPGHEHGKEANDSKSGKKDKQGSGCC